MLRTGNLMEDQSLEHNARHRFRNQRQRDGRHADISCAAWPSTRHLVDTNGLSDTGRGAAEDTEKR